MGESLGRYTLLRRVAAGGMAEIWKAKVVGPAGFQKTVAIKRILPHLLEETEFIQMFIEEAKLAAELVHPNIIQVFDFGHLGQSDYFIAMEYVAGPSLARLLKRIAERQGTFPAICAIYVIAEAAKGLAHAHAKCDEGGKPLNIVHRDVSPQNVLLSYSGDVKIGDFGIAKAAGAVTRTQEGQVRGKLNYMSPEQANGRKDIDGRSDLFSLGVCLYELVTGRRLFPSNLTTIEAYGRVAGFKGLDLEDMAAVPQPFRELVGKALRAQPGERFQSGTELEMACTTMLGSKGVARAREQLATLVQTLFDEEKALEMTPVPTGTASVTPGESPVVVGSFSGANAVSSAPFVPGETVKSPIVPLQMPQGSPVRPSPTPAPQSQSGLTLASSKLNVQPQVNAPNVAVVVEEPRGRGSPAMIAAFAGGLAMLIVALGLAAKLAGFGAAPAADTTLALATPPTSAVAATASATPTPAAMSEATPEATPDAAPRVRTTPAALGVVRTSTTPPIATPTRPPVKGMGTLSVTSRPWVQVWVDNKMVKQETPLTGHRLPSGRHRVRLVNAGQKFDETRMINVPADGEASVHVDVRNKTISVK